MVLSAIMPHLFFVRSENHSQWPPKVTPRWILVSTRGIGVSTWRLQLAILSTGQLSFFAHITQLRSRFSFLKIIVVRCHAICWLLKLLLLLAVDFADVKCVVSCSVLVHLGVKVCLCENGRIKVCTICTSWCFRCVIQGTSSWA